MRHALRVAVMLGMATALSACSGDDTGSCPSGLGGAGGGGTCEPAGPCPASCANGSLDPGETCDPPGSCPSSCDDGDACTTDSLMGSAASCNAACVHAPVPGCMTTTAGAGGASGLGGASGGGGASGVSGASGAGGAGGVGGAPIDCDEGAIGTSPSTLAVSVEGAEQIIPKEIFGVLMEILGKDINDGIYVGTGSAIPNTHGIRNDIIDGFKEAGVGAIEWPGGCAANNYDWQANRNPPNTMGTDLFMELCNAVDAEPVLVGRPKPEFAQSNKDWVSYVNDNDEHPEWTLKYFKVGNEVWGCGGNLGDDVATYETWYNAHYDTLRAPVNGKELLLIGATGGIWTVNPGTTNWMTTMLSSGHLVDKVDGIEVHDYIYFPDSVPSAGFSDNQYYDIVWRANEGQIGPRVRDIKTILDSKDPSGRIKIIEDEWGDWLIEASPSDTWLQQVTLMDAISAAEHLHVFIEHADRVQMAGLAQATNVIHSLFLTNSSSGGTDLVKTPAFYVFKMFLPHHVQGAKWAPLTLDSEDITGNGKSFPVLSAGATVNDSGEVNISLVNVDLANARDVTVTLDGAAGYTVASAQVITGDQKDSFNAFGQAEDVSIQPMAEASYAMCGHKLKVSLPSKSVVMLSLTAL